MTSKPINTSTFKHTFKTDTDHAIDSTSTNIIVLKIGSSSITAPDGRILVSNLGRFVEFAHELKLKGYKPVIVSSGAVSVGVNKLKMTERPKNMVVKQAVAAVGQNALMTLYDNLFAALNLTSAQVLLTRDNINSGGHYLNATNTLEQLLAMDIVPIVNENDAVSIEELKIGDNDSLSAMVSCMLNAKHLFLATDVSSLYTADPKSDPTATPIHLIEDINTILKKFSQPASDSAGTVTSGRWGTGGIATKVTAANLCAACGVDSSIISSSSLDDVFTILANSYTVGTTFKAHPAPYLTGRKKFLWVAMTPVGDIYVDHACAELFTGVTGDISRSYHLLSAGILWCSGKFERGSCVNVVVADDEFLKKTFGKNNYVSPAQLHAKHVDSQVGQGESGKQGQEARDDENSNNQCNQQQRSRSVSNPKHATAVTSATIPNGTVIGRGIVNFCVEDVMKIRGLNSKEIDTVLSGTHHRHNVVESDNLAIHYRAASSK